MIVTFLLGLSGVSGLAQTVLPAALEVNLSKAGTNRAALVAALDQTPPAQKPGMYFLLENMPTQDLQSLSAALLRDNVALAYEAKARFSWAKELPEDIFLNEVLPYASVNEPRDNWRRRLQELCVPLVKDCKTASEAAQVINQKLFRQLGVKYSRKRRAPDQGPFETMETGVATCTGLSILLVDACRSVGIPARIAGTPLWVNKSGNHTWVEIWDREWFFAGAAEADPKGFNRGWFVGNASQALKDVPEHAIYASSFRRTDVKFPLSWAPGVDFVSAVNVTDRYATKVKPATADKVKVNFQVFDHPVGERVVAKVTVTDAADPKARWQGESKSPTDDINFHLGFELPARRTFIVETEQGTHRQSQYYTTAASGEDLLNIYLDGIPEVKLPPPVCHVPPAVADPLDAKLAAKLQAELTAFFNAGTNRQTGWKFSSAAEKALRKNEAAMRALAWQAFLAATNHGDLRASYSDHKVRFNEHVSPYTVKTVGTRSERGWGLVIAMHGGGGTTQEFNDQQWRHMQIYYREHPEVGGYLYVALRAPNNTWNGFYTDYAYPLMANLVQQFLLCGDVDPNKVFIMGYSHGGYGAYAMGPKMADRFAGIHASAAALADGAVADTLRNTVFITMVGGKDTAYGRNKRVLDLLDSVKKLRGDRSDIYPISIQIIADHPHSGLPDRDAIADMYPAVRNPAPRDITWVMTDRVINDFFWLRVPAPVRGERFEVTCRDNTITVSSPPAVSQASVLLDSRLVDFDKPVKLAMGGHATSRKLKPSLRTLCESLQRRGDPELAFTAELPLSVSAKSK